MGITVLTNALVLVNSVDLSDHCSKVTTEDTRDSVDITAMGALSKAVTKGLGDAKVTLEFFQDTAAGKTHATLQPLVGSSVGVPIEIRPVNAARGTTNPAFLMTGLLMNYTFLDGKVGDASSISAEFVNASQSGVTYPTS